MSSFVRQGASSGWVAVTLHGRNGRDVTIKRVMRAAANSSDWSINGAGGGHERVACSHGFPIACMVMTISHHVTGRDARQREVLEAVEGLNIRLDNLCQVRRKGRR